MLWSSGVAVAIYLFIFFFWGGGGGREGGGTGGLGALLLLFVILFSLCGFNMQWYQQLFFDKDDMSICYERVWDKEKIPSLRRESSPLPHRYRLGALTTELRETLLNYGHLSRFICDMLSHARDK